MKKARSARHRVQDNESNKRRNTRNGHDKVNQESTSTPKPSSNKTLLMILLLVFLFFTVSNLVDPIKVISALIESRQHGEHGKGHGHVNEEKEDQNIDVDRKKDALDNGNSVDKIAKFKSGKHFSLRPKNMVIDGREIVFQELKHNISDSGVHIYIADNFLSGHECNALSSVHSKHVLEYNKLPPLICFDSKHTLTKNLEEAGIKIDVDKIQFSAGTLCLNESISKVLRDRFTWSYSTAFYPGESKFSNIFEDRVEKTTQLKQSQGGKFQITSYPQRVGYKNHTDCTVGSGARDRFATVLVYLQDVKEGGQTTFPLLGISVQPKQGRLLVWNSMTMDGQCDEWSLHNAAKVVKGHKFILQRWYYYESFFSLGKRPPEPELPKRRPLQPRVSCDQYEYGSCRWYDEWGYDHIVEYNQIKSFLP